MDAEKSVIACCLMSATALDDMQAMLSPDDFHSDAHRIIFQNAIQMSRSGRPVDSVTLAEELKRKGVLEDVGGVPSVGQIFETVPHAGNAEYYAKIVLDSSRRRKLIETAQGIIESAYSEAETTDIVGVAESRLHSILQSESRNQPIEVRQALEGVFAQLEGNEPPGISTGWEKLDELYQLQPGNLIYIAGRPGMGKTGLATNLAINVAASGKRCLIFSLEQSKIEMGARLLSSWTQVSGLKINRMEPISDEEKNLILSKASSLADLPIDIDDEPSTTISRITATARLWKRKHGLGLIVIDYLQLIEPENRRIPREQQVAVMSRELKKLAGQLEVPVVCLAQLNRQNENRPGNRPRLSDLRESGSLEQDANVVLFIHRPEVYADERPGEADLIVAKNRNGRTGIVPLQFEKSTVTFRNLAFSMASYGNNEW